MWDYCTLSKFDLDKNPGILDNSDIIRIDYYNQLMDFIWRTVPFSVVDEEIIMELVNYFINRDMILAASLTELETNEQEN